MKVYEYVLRIKDQATDRLRTLRNMAVSVQRDIRGFGGQLRSLGTDISNFLGVGMLTRLAPAAIAAGIGLIGNQAVSLAADLEQTKVGFEVFLDSAERATKLVSDLRQMAKVTPFETRDLVQATETMLGFGIAGDKVLDNLQMLGDVARGDANRLRLITLAFSQIQAAGRLTGQDLLQLINAGFNPLQEISQRTGRSLAQLRKDMEEGSISAQMVSDAFFSATREGGRFFQMMDRQSKTFKGIASTLRDEWNIGLTALGEKLLPTANAGLLRMRSILNDLTTNIDWTPLLSAITDTRNIIGDLLGLFSSAGNQVSVLQFLVSTLAFSFRTLTLPIRGTLTLIMLLVELVDKAVASIGGLGKAFIGLRTFDPNMINEGLTQAKNALASGFDNIKSRVADFVRDEAKGYASIFNPSPTDPFGQQGSPSGRAGVLAGTGTGSGSAADLGKDGIDKITGGGRQAVNVTINLDNLVGVQNFDVKNIREGMRDMEKAVVETLLRVVNSAQYAASQ